ncbi:MAG: VWA domain-containing protein [Solirubrobacterales bacterium]|nr:VWA domain-containing protein [Solirubrobacterales bacterium]
MPELIDLPAFASAFGRAVHDAGIPVTSERSVRFAHALTLAPPLTNTRLYWTARTVFVSGLDQLATFDRVFAAVFDGLRDPAQLRGDPNAPRLPGVEIGPRPARADAPALQTAPAGAAPPGSQLRELDRAREDTGRELAVAAASAQERLAERNFAELEHDELHALWRLMRELALAPPMRRARRTRRCHHGARLDVRATMRASGRTGGDPARRVLRRRVMRPRRLVLICDISGSMEPYTRAFLQLLLAAVGGANAEAFVFATRLTRLTRLLRGRRPDLAIERAAEAARDWSSGTRIGEALQRFNDEHGRRALARGAVVVIISDGWERGDPALVAREMQRLARLAYRIVWVNPRKASRDYAPLAGGMAAALPFCDAFVSGHNLRAMSAVADAIAVNSGGASR